MEPFAFSTMHATAAAPRDRWGRWTLYVLEDLHWADEATLYLVRFLARRLDGIQLLLVTTYRDDEVRAGHPLTMVMGDVATAAGVARMHVPLLTQAAVAQLIGNLARASIPPSSTNKLVAIRST